MKSILIALSVQTALCFWGVVLMVSPPLCRLPIAIAQELREPLLPTGDLPPRGNPGRTLLSGEVLAAAEDHTDLRLSAAGTTDDSGASILTPAAPGLQSILSHCWSREQLSGKSETPEKIRSQAVHTSSPPTRPDPLCHPAPLPSDRQGSLRSVEIPADKGKPVALTFDLCESGGKVSGYEADLVNILRDNRVPATFFAGGKWMQSHPEETMQLMADQLFEIGNHSWSHAHFSQLDGTQMEREILWTQAQYEILRERLLTRKCVQEAGQLEMDKVPPIPLLFRFPYGTCTPAALRTVNQLGLAAIQWSIVTGDAAPSQTAGGIVRIVRQQIKPGAIIIGHANGRGHGIVAALKELIPELRQSGYAFVTVSQLLALGNPIDANSCYENKPNDNRHYDRRRSRQIP